MPLCSFPTMRRNVPLTTHLLQYPAGIRPVRIRSRNAGFTDLAIWYNTRQSSVVQCSIEDSATIYLGVKKAYGFSLFGEFPGVAPLSDILFLICVNN